MAKKKNRDPRDIGVWTMLRDVLVASMNKGQFPLALAALIYILMVFRMPPQDVSRLMFEIVTTLKTHYYFGYVLSAILGLGWFLHGKSQRRCIQEEMDRVSEERNKLQRRQLSGRIESSEER